MDQPILKPSFALTAFQLKVVAALLMIIDHVGVMLDVEWMRIVGRFSFPLFAWLLSQGAKHTRSWQRYQWRLLILAIASQPIHAVFRQSLIPLNPIFQLWLGLVLIRVLQQPRIRMSLWMPFFGLAGCLIDYDYYGLGLVYLISSYPYLLPKAVDQIDLKVNTLLWVMTFVILHLLYSTINPLQIYALPFIALLPLLNRIHDRGPKARWFYWFYPLHFIPLLIWRGFSWIHP